MKKTPENIDESQRFHENSNRKPTQLATACAGRKTASRPASNSPDAVLMQVASPDAVLMQAKPASAGTAVENESTAAPQFERDWFPYRGREWRIFKRGTGPKAKWYLYFEHQHKRYLHCCGETNKKAAIETAKIKIDAVLDGHKETLKRSMMKAAPQAYSTIPELIQHYERAVLDIAESTQRTNVNCFKLVLRKALGVETMDGLHTSCLSADTGRDYFKHALKASKEHRDQQEQARVKRSANSIFRQAKCLFTPKMQADYLRAGIVLPDLAGFLASFKEEKFEGVSASYDPPAERVVRRTLHEWLKVTDRNMFLAIGLELACGLRKAEVAQVTWGMLTRSMGSPLLDGRGKVKNQTGSFVVTPVDPFWRLMNARVEREKWRGKDGELVLQGTATDLADCIFRNVGAWLRGLGWSTQKTNHALRAYVGSLVAMKYEIYQASKWLRHRSVKTTETHYTHFLDGRVFKPEKVRIAWAR